MGKLIGVAMIIVNWTKDAQVECLSWKNADYSGSQNRQYGPVSWVSRCGHHSATRSPSCPQMI